MRRNLRYCLLRPRTGLLSGRHPAIVVGLSAPNVRLLFEVDMLRKAANGRRPNTAVVDYWSTGHESPCRLGRWKRSFAYRGELSKLKSLQPSAAY